MAETSNRDRVAVITGASRGLGRAMAVALGEAGIRLALVARDAAKLEETAAAVRAAGGEARIFLADVAKEEDVLRLKDEVAAAFNGRVDILVNNAGINHRKNLVEFTLPEWQRVMDTNVTSVFLLCRAFIPLMQGRGWGRILNLTSIMAHVSMPGRTVYSTTKTALLGLTRALALELAPDGITVNGISPGPIGTEMNTPIMQNPELNAQFIARIPVGRWGKESEIGELARFLCSDAAGFITGTDILIDGGWCAQ